jgi:hypothetical protein
MYTVTATEITSVTLTTAQAERMLVRSGSSAATVAIVRDSDNRVLGAGNGIDAARVDAEIQNGVRITFGGFVRDEQGRRTGRAGRAWSVLEWYELTQEGPRRPVALDDLEVIASVTAAWPL